MLCVALAQRPLVLLPQRVELLGVRLLGALRLGLQLGDDGLERGELLGVLALRLLRVGAHLGQGRLMLVRGGAERVAMLGVALGDLGRLLLLELPQQGAHLVQRGPVPLLQSLDLRGVVPLGLLGAGPQLVDQGLVVARLGVGRVPLPRPFLGCLLGRGELLLERVRMLLVLLELGAQRAEDRRVLLGPLRLLALVLRGGLVQRLAVRRVALTERARMRCLELLELVPQPRECCIALLFELIGERGERVLVLLVPRLELGRVAPLRRLHLVCVPLLQVLGDQRVVPQHRVKPVLVLLGERCVLAGVLLAQQLERLLVVLAALLGRLVERALVLGLERGDLVRVLGAHLLEGCGDVVHVGHDVRLHHGRLYLVPVRLELGAEPAGGDGRRDRRAAHRALHGRLRCGRAQQVGKRRVERLVVDHHAFVRKRLIVRLGLPRDAPRAKGARRNAAQAVRAAARRAALLLGDGLVDPRVVLVVVAELLVEHAAARQAHAALAQRAAQLGHLLTEPPLLLVVAPEALDRHRELGAQLLRLGVRRVERGRRALAPGAVGAAKVQVPAHAHVRGGHVAHVGGLVAWLALLGGARHGGQRLGARCPRVRVLEAADLPLQVRHVALEAGALLAREGLVHIALLLQLLQLLLHLLVLGALELVRLADPVQVRGHTRSLALGLAEGRVARTRLVLELLLQHVQVPVLLPGRVARLLERGEPRLGRVQLVVRVLPLLLHLRAFLLHLLQLPLQLCDEPAGREARCGHVTAGGRIAAKRGDDLLEQPLLRLLQLVHLGGDLLPVGRSALAHIVHQRLELALVLQEPLPQQPSRVHLLADSGEVILHLLEHVCHRGTPARGARAFATATGRTRSRCNNASSAVRARWRGVISFGRAGRLGHARNFAAAAGMRVEANLAVAAT